MIDPVRQEVVALAHTVVVKVGTNVLTRADGALEPARVQALADQLHRLRATGRKVALVSSGAIGAGMGRLGLGAASHRPAPAPGVRRGRPDLPDARLRGLPGQTPASRRPSCC